MKNFILLSIALLSFSAYSQNEFEIEHCKDVMNDAEYFFVKKNILATNKEKTKGFSIYPSFKKSTTGIAQNGLICKAINIGTCVEDNSLIFLFSDDTKITITSWNKFNCEGKAWFNLTEEEYKDLSTKKLKAMRFTNGRSFESLTYNLTEVESNYFTSAYTNHKIVEVSCN